METYLLVLKESCDTLSERSRLQTTSVVIFVDREKEYVGGGIHTCVCIWVLGFQVTFFLFTFFPNMKLYEDNLCMLQSIQNPKRK